jgi:cell migration-inducing and hyaluronan-binding protein
MPCCARVVAFLSRRWRGGGVFLGLFLAMQFGATAIARAQMPPVVCNSEMQLPVQGLMPPGSPQPNLLVNGPCKVDMAQNGANPTVFYYGNVDIVSGGSLNFNQPKTVGSSPDIDFWASSIIVEANGALTAGTSASPYGDPNARQLKDPGFLTIHLYGKNLSVGDPAQTPGQGVMCAPPAAGFGPCGIPSTVWTNNGSTILPGCPAGPITKDSNCIPGLSAAAKDYFYAYAPLYGDGLCTNGSTFAVKDGKAMCGAASADGMVGYFGYKVLAVSYGGTLTMYGYKGVAAGIDSMPLNSGNSWMRLSGDLSPGPGPLNVSGMPDQRWWLGSDNRPPANDPMGPPLHPIQAVVTTTDYLPGHSEVLTIKQVQGNQVYFTQPIKWFHSGTRYPVGSKITDPDATKRLRNAGMDGNLIDNGAETRAAVALLTRNIRIVSEGDKAGETFALAAGRTPCPGTIPMTMGCYYFGGHTIFRQGFKQIQIDGVEFAELGQGGKIGHYPIHFHKTRQVPPGTFVNDSSVNQSNTRWYALHDTQGVTLQRDIGWKSIGHGYYLEDGTETDNNFYSDIGIFARAAVANPQNPQMIPGILADNQSPSSFLPPKIPNPGFPYRSDNEYPAVFWITNGWNNFQGDMAAGAGACGAAYWFVPMQNSDTPDVLTASNFAAGGHMKWDNGAGVFGYAGLQRGSAVPFDTIFAGSSPIESFSNNYATSTMMSLQTTPDAPTCAGFIAAQAPATAQTVREIASFAPKPARGPVNPADPSSPEGPNPWNDTYYPHVIGAKKTTSCPPAFQVIGLPRQFDCRPPPQGKIAQPCSDGSTFAPNDPNSPENNCAVTVIDHFTSSFHWAQGNVSAVWLRPFWYLVTNSVITDVQQGGITFVTGGDVTRSSIISGYWGLLRDSILVGHTQPQDQAHRFALDIGPFNSFTSATDKLTCAATGSYCLSAQEGVSLPLDGFFSNQRLENIYDGPSYRDSTAYLDVTTALCQPGDAGCIYGTSAVKGILKDPTPNSKKPCYLPNAAIAWKQPNGFFYPPAFHANDLYFGVPDGVQNGVDIRHFVIDPLFKAYDGSISPYKSPPMIPPSPDFGQGGTYISDSDAVNAVYCLPSGLAPSAVKQYFNGFTSIDRQTELNDDDGTVTGLSNDVQMSPDPPNPLKQTISVNEDDFFTAPVEAPECASNVGGNVAPGHACTSPSKMAPTVTAKTSPYDYVSTVVYHTPFGNIWDADCSNPKCYGVPLYRQFLAGTKGADEAASTREWKHWYHNGCNTDPTKFGITEACRWPFIRMAGTSLSTRETLTINNGTYYLDTTVPAMLQKSEVYNTENNGNSLNSFVNVFQPDTQINPNLKFTGTYNVFFVYAKPTTRQTYLIYLGKDATAAAIKAIQVRLDNLTNQPDFPTTQPWLVVSPVDANSGIVTVTVDFTKLTDNTLQVIPDNGLCEPHTFCKATSGTSCGSALALTDPLYSQSVAVCGQWAVKDLDCPPKGCYGFSITIPKGFAPDATMANPSPHRPAPVAFPTDALNQGKPAWPVKFLGTTLNPDATGGQCHYSPMMLPGSSPTCTVPDWVPQ